MWLMRLDRKFQAIFSREVVMSGMNTRGRRNFVPESIDFKFLAGMAIVAAAMIAISLAMNVPVSEVAMFAAR
jgi:hypothetical protein